MLDSQRSQPPSGKTRGAFCPLYKFSMSTYRICPQFDCAHLDSTYDCGCGDTPISAAHVDDLERDLSEDDITGVKLIKGGR